MAAKASRHLLQFAQQGASCPSRAQMSRGPPHPISQEHTCFYSLTALGRFPAPHNTHPDCPVLPPALSALRSFDLREAAVTVWVLWDYAMNLDRSNDNSN